MYNKDLNWSVVRSQRSASPLSEEAPTETVAPPQPAHNTEPLSDTALGQVLSIAREETQRRDAELRITNIALRQEIAQLKRFEVDLARTTRALMTLSAGNQALVHAVNEPQLLQGAVDAAVISGGYRMAWAGLIVPDAPDSVVPVVFSGDADTYLEAVVQAHRSDVLMQEILLDARAGLPVITRDTLGNQAFLPWREIAATFEFRAVVTLPLLSVSGDALGVLMIYAAEAEAFDDYEMRILDELAGDVAYGIENLRSRSLREDAEAGLKRSNEQLERMLHDVTSAMGRIVETRDPYTQGHEVRVAGLSRQIAGRMGLSAEDQDAVEMAGMVHDIGKLCVPTEILTKPGALSDAEFNLIRQHASQGFDILKDIAFPWPLAEIVLQHHERMDGSGYPDNLRGDDIHLLARVLAVADVVEAMASDRPYRPSLGIEAAISEISDDRGRLDPEVVQACLALYETGSLEL